ncbi:cephalotocin receptor 1-like [Haliotis cracherodii]|uniref:cephalotocin receptor 1-like n=1 Tax=Haliotis rufescens TaxID=6454 RepID=UPI001EAF8E15|nr:cephalotocin receptor 1-like [Haliotis rufescens]
METEAPPATYGAMEADNGTVTYSLSETHNSSTSNTTRLGGRSEELAKVEIAVQSIILYFAIFGNLFVLIVLRLRKQKLTRMQCFIVHLSLADIFVGIFNVLPQLVWDITYRFSGNDFLCRSMKYFQLVAMYASSYVLVMTAIDRYVSICHPLTSQTMNPKRVHLMTLLAWGLALIFSIPQIIIFSRKEVYKGIYDCWATFDPPWTDYLNTVWSFVSIYALPTLLLAFCYGRICHVVWISVGSKEDNRLNRKRKNKSIMWRITFRKSQNQQNTEDETDPKLFKSNSMNPRGHVRSMSKSKVKTIKMTLAVVLCYVICWTPFYTALMWSTFDENAHLTSTSMTIILLLASLNSCTNPWIYLCFSGRICGKVERRMSRSWTQTTQVTHTNDSESRSRHSNYDISPHTSRDISPWARTSMTSSC